MDVVPVLSQVKSLIQWITQDSEGARRTQENFSRQCPIISQARSAVEAAMGRTTDARETQKEFGRFTLHFVDGIPVVGHIKGGIHYALKDKQGGDAAMKSASHTTAVIGGAVGGFFVGGPPVAAAMAMGAGVAMDAAITGVDSAIHKEFKPCCTLEPLADPKNAGKWCDAIGVLAFDAATGFLTGKVIKSVKTANGATPKVILDSVARGKIIVRAFADVANSIQMIVKSDKAQLFFRILKASKNLYKMTENFYRDLDKAEDKGKKEAEKLGVSFKRRGDVFEVYFEGRLVAVNDGARSSMVNNEGELEEIEDGQEYCICTDGTFRLKPEEEEGTKGPAGTLGDRTRLLALLDSVSFACDCAEGKITC